uniref:AlNc14C60G4404 protein n=1 Tax=Albugo laibachii Nc14 TaxID=890382 RepID=F0WCM0_9STRA|nr:AlNc14C60G4404 [Albugo laibachii Nc14]|eukprot:CCA18941.1 AlNc14C60G4404 [Albugo laibachii Nc14]
MTITRTDFPRSDTAEAFHTLSITDRYLVVQLTILGAPVYIHNVYVSVEPTERKAFLTSFQPDLLNKMRLISYAGILTQPCAPVWIVAVVPIDTSQLSCLEWLSNSGVLDAWRQDQPEERVFTGPQPRKNRLDYILLSESLFCSIYKDSTYVPLPHTGNHLDDILAFANPSQLQGRGYWKCPLSLFDYPVIKDAIKVEAAHILDTLRSSSHPGKD